LFLKGGVAALSVRAISKAAGLSTIGIYSHFQGKQGILDTLYIEGFDLVYQAMDIETDGKASIEHVMLACQGYLSVAQENEAHYRLIFGESDASYSPSKEARDAADRAFGKLVKNTEEFLQISGKTTDKFRVSMDIWALLHGYVSISHHTRNNQEIEWQEMAACP